MIPPCPFRDPCGLIRGLDSLFAGDFWQWAHSDLLNTTDRSILAEFLVGSALLVSSRPRAEWDPTDTDYRGKTVEVTSAADIQSFDLARPSSIRFEIGTRCRWNEETSRHEDTRCRHADCSVFCLLTEQDRSLVDPLDLARWAFYVLATETIDERFRDRKPVVLSRVEDCCHLVDFGCLATEVDRVLFRERAVHSSPIEPDCLDTRGSLPT